MRRCSGDDVQELTNNDLQLNPSKTEIPIFAPEDKNCSDQASPAVPELLCSVQHQKPGGDVWSINVLGDIQGKCPKTVSSSGEHLKT